MIGSTLDKLIGVFSPATAVKRTHQRKTLERMFQGAEANRLTNNKKPKNQSADAELLGPFGADALRAWSRALVRDNAYAWGVVDTIVSSVVGCGIGAQSQIETPEGTDIEDVNDIRDKAWAEWCEVCDVNGRMNFAEIQQLVQREMVEAGEVIIHLVKTPSLKYRGIYRPIPLAIEVIEADRIATERDTWKIRSDGGNKIIRGVELDDLGKPLAYWIYPEHPNGPYSTRVLPERIDAADILHLYRMDRIGQTRGVSWFAPVMSWLRDLGVYVDNEIQASAVASCFGVAITTTGRAGSGLMPSTDEDQTDTNGNQFEYLEPAMVVRLQPGESVESINPGRPNSASEPWINLMLRGISVGTGLSYEVVSRNYSGTSYSSSRTSMLEDRRRFRRWQKYIVQHCCQPIWDRFCDQAATAGVDGFPSMTEILDDRRASTAVEWQAPAWEWVDPQSEQAASDAALTSFQSTYQDELGQRGKNWRNVFYQRAKEEKLKRTLGLMTREQSDIELAKAEAEKEKALAGNVGGGGGSSQAVAATALNGAQVTSLVGIITQIGTGALPKESAVPMIAAAFPSFTSEQIDQMIGPIHPGTISADGVPTGIPEGAAETAPSGVYMGLSTQQWNRNRKAIQKTLDEVSTGTMGEATARVFLKSVGMPDADIDVLLADAKDGSVDTPLDEVTANGK
jgi:lambda family phage portal protein